MGYSRLSASGMRSLDGYRFPDIPPEYRARNGWLFAAAGLVVLVMIVAIGVGAACVINGGGLLGDGLLGELTTMKCAGAVLAGSLTVWVLSDWVDARVEAAYWTSPMGQAEMARPASQETYASARSTAAAQ